MIARVLQALLAWLVGAALAYALASVAHTQTVLAGLGALGVAIPVGERLATTFGDLAGLWAYGLVIGLSLGLGLVIVRLVSRRAWEAPGGSVRAALAGALAIGAALAAMRLAFSFSPIASARGAVGFALQCAAGAAGGVAFRACLVGLRQGRDRGAPTRTQVHPSVDGAGRT